MLGLLVSLAVQELYPIEHHTWLRYKPGTWVKNSVTIESGGRATQGTQTMTLKETGKEDYVVEEADSMAPEGAPPPLTRFSRGTRVGTETVKIGDKEFRCTVWVVKGTRRDEAGEMRFWLPEGRHDPVRMTTKMPNFEADALATSLDEKLKVGEREIPCVKLEGKLKMGDMEGTVAFWHTQAMPSSQARFDMTFKAPEGPVTIRIQAVDFKELK